MGTNRTGRVSAIDYEHGTYEVTYFDRGRSVTRQLSAVSNGEYKMPQIGQIVSVIHNSNGTATATAIGTIWNKSNRPVAGYEGLFRKEFGDHPGQGYESYDSNSGEYKLYANKSSGRRSGYIHDTASGSYQLSAGGAARFKAEGAMQLLAGKDQVQSVKGKQEITVEGEKTETAKSATLTYPDGLTIEAGGATITVSASGVVSVSSPVGIKLDAPNISVTGITGDVKVKSISLVNHTHQGSGEGKPQ